ncbi:MAG: hypothetical protein OXL37_13025 [Chloroflexota bacterium]|nr:hypothetical protein [Chloroflexota bacterium]MDE2959179.1 hypothetical protein [Chloroflexota bacterium]
MLSRTQSLRRVSVGTFVWAMVGLTLWIFLLSPYWTSTINCFDSRQTSNVRACLKSVASDLRRDSNLATYATATVAAAIAFQLSNRSRQSNPPRE